MIELTTWFRRAIWFLAFTSATTLSPGLFLTAAALGLVFELVYNITNARMYWDTVIGYDEHDKGNVNYVDDYDKQDKDDYPAAYDYDYPTSIYPIATNLQKSLYQRQFYRPTNNQFRRFYISPSISARAQARPFHVSPYNNFNQNMWRNRQNFLNRRIDMVVTEEHASEDKKSEQSNKLLNWRYLLGLPPWFLKE